MGGTLQWFGRECRDTIVGELAGYADEAGKLGVAVARQHVPVVTGRLKRSIGYTLNQKTLELTLYADEPYALWVELRKPYLRFGQAAMAEAFGGKSSVQFATLPEKYHERARVKLRKAGVRRAVVGHRPVARPRKKRNP
jgi:hypothetical protein